MSGLTTSQEIKTDNLTIQSKREPGCTVVLDIFISPKATEAAYQRAIKNINKEISFPGFRKGHAPAPVLEQKFSKEIQEEFRRVTTETAFSEAMKALKIYPRTEKSISNVDLPSIDRKEGAKLHVEFECHPDVPQVDFTGFSFEPVAPHEIGDKQIEESIYNLQLEYGTYETIEGRPVERGDFILVDVHALVGEAKEPVPVLEGRIIEVGSPFTEEWVSELVLGHNVGESVEGEAPCSASDHHGHNHGRRITILEIQSGTIAPLNEELAKKVGCDNEEVLRQRIRMQLERNEQHRQTAGKAFQLEQFFNKHFDFDVPKSMYEGSAKFLLKQELKKLEKNEGWEQDYAQKSEEIQESIEKDLKQALRRFLICNKVAQDENITVSEQELYMEHLSEVIREGRQPKEIEENEVARIYSKLLQQKVMSYLVEKVEAKAQ